MDPREPEDQFWNFSMEWFFKDSALSDDGEREEPHQDRTNNNMEVLHQLKAFQRPLVQSQGPLRKLFRIWSNFALAPDVCLLFFVPFTLVLS